MLKKLLIILLFFYPILTYANANDSCDLDLVCRVLSRVSSPYYKKSLYDIILKKENMVKLLKEKGYKQEEAIKIIKYQPNNIGFLWGEAFKQSLLSVKDLYKNSISDGWTLVNAYSSIGSYKAIKKAKDFSKDFSLIVEGLISGLTLPDIKSKEKKFFQALSNFKKRGKFTIDEIKDVIDFLAAIKELLLMKGSKLNNFIIELAQVRIFNKQLLDYENFIKLVNKNDPNIKNDIRIKLLANKELMFIKRYYDVVELEANFHLLRAIAELFDNDVLRSVSIAYKFGTGYAGIKPTFDQNFGTYASISYEIYSQNITDIIDTYYKLTNKLENLVNKYKNGDFMSKEEIQTLVNLWNKYKYNSDDYFGTYVVNRYLKTGRKIVLQEINPINVKDGEDINLPVIGTIYNTTADEVKNLTLQIWGKHGLIYNKKLSLYDGAVGSDNVYNFFEIGDNGINLKIDKENAFYDKIGGFYYYKYGVFDENMNMIYTYIKQEGGGYAPGWDYTDNKKSQLVIPDKDRNGEVIIENAYGVIPFYMNDIEYELNSKLEKFYKITHKKDGKLPTKKESLFKYIVPINKFNKEEISKKLSRIFGVNITLSKDKYQVKDILRIDFIILKKIDNNAHNYKNKIYGERARSILSMISKLQSKYKNLSALQITYLVLHKKHIIDFGYSDLDKPLTYGVFVDEIVRLYHFIVGK